MTTSTDVPDDACDNFSGTGRSQSGEERQDLERERQQQLPESLLRARYGPQYKSVQELLTELPLLLAQRPYPGRWSDGRAKAHWCAKHSKDPVFETELAAKASGRFEQARASYQDAADIVIHARDEEGSPDGNTADIILHAATAALGYATRDIMREEVFEDLTASYEKWKHDTLHPAPVTPECSPAASSGRRLRFRRRLSRAR